MDKLDIVILAAGKGERMVSRKPKVMHEIMGKPLLGYVIEAAKSLRPSNTIVVTGYGRESVESFLEGKGVLCAFQAEQKGTAHALLCAREFFDGNDILVLLGDVPLIEAQTLARFLEFCSNSKSIVFLTTDVDDPSGYGRVIMDGDVITDIREDADASDAEKQIRRINTGICYIPFESLTLVDQIGEDNKKGERYLTDICRVAQRQGKNAKGFFYARSEDVLGINTKKGLLDANIIMSRRINAKHMERGVTLLSRDIFIDNDVTIGRDTVIAPNCHISGKTSIGEGVEIGPFSVIRNCVLQDNVTIEGLVSMEGVEVEKGVRISSFVKLRDNIIQGQGRTLIKGT